VLNAKDRAAASLAATQILQFANQLTKRLGPEVGFLALFEAAAATVAVGKLPPEAHPHSDRARRQYQDHKERVLQALLKTAHDATG
jgi:hypothetical protein